ncbi:MAG: NUDIX domain-containing protein [Ruegeria sp.]
MSDLFFYGTLRHKPLLELVMGRPIGELSVTETVLPDHAVYSVKDHFFPMIVAEPGSTAQGIIAHGLDENDLNRLAFYEGGFDYALEPRDLLTPDGQVLQAEVFFPAPGVWTPGKPWSLDEWASVWGPVTVCAADEVMAHYGRVESQVIARSFPAIRSRAWARLAAQERQKGPSQTSDADIVVHQRQRAYINYFAMEEVDLQYRRYDGSMGPTLSRNALMQGSVVVVLPYDPVRDVVLIVEQFRAPVFMIDDPEPWMWEAVAGMIDPGETPEQAAIRESREEAHIDLSALEYAGGAYSSSGSSTEFAHLYVGLAELTETTDSGGVADEGEDIRSKILPFDEFMDLVDRNAFKNLQLLTLANWLARHRERLRT